MVMEVDLAPVGGGNEAMVAFTDERCDDAVRRSFVPLPGIGFQGPGFRKATP
jgi:hypothetical protein